MAQRRCTYTIDMDKKILQCVNNDKYKMTLPDGSERILWSKISKLHFPELGHRSVRQRFMRVLNPDLNKDPFSGEEDVQLLRLVKRFKTSWSLILPHMPGRSDVQLSNRYRTLKKTMKNAWEKPKKMSTTFAHLHKHVKSEDEEDEEATSSDDDDELETQQDTMEDTYDEELEAAIMPRIKIPEDEAASLSSPMIRVTRRIEPPIPTTPIRNIKRVLFPSLQQQVEPAPPVPPSTIRLVPLPQQLQPDRTILVDAYEPEDAIFMDMSMIESYENNSQQLVLSQQLDGNDDSLCALLPPVQTTFTTFVCCCDEESQQQSQTRIKVEHLASLL